MDAGIGFITITIEGCTIMSEIFKTGTKDGEPLLNRQAAERSVSAVERLVRRLVTWQHEDTGYIFTKEIPEGVTTPEFKRRFIIKVEAV